MAEPRRTALYRFYDAQEELLYVGITNNPQRRWSKHARTKPWYPQVRHQTITWYDSEPEARAAETKAIRGERPQHNIAGAIRPPQPRFTLQPNIVTQVCAIWACIPGGLSMATLMTAVFAPHLFGLHYIRVLADVLGWVSIVMTVSLPIPILTLLLVALTPEACRFTYWLNRNFGDFSRRSAVEANTR